MILYSYCMQWLVGIDEAGYGPNLGPLVQAAAATLVADAQECLWAKHRDSVCRATEPQHGRIVVDDSKLVHIGANKLGKLEANLRRLLPANRSIADLTNPDVEAELRQECWYDPTEFVAIWPVENGGNALPGRASPIIPIHELAGLSIPFVHAVITCPRRFNELTDRHGTKAAPLAEGVRSLLRTAVDQLADRPIAFVIDKQGGRNHYAPFVSDAFPEGWVRVFGESGNCSRYDVEGLGRPIHVVFQPKAERHCLPVAVASMMAKYLRERLMMQFNRFWIDKLPALAPTAGYPTDAKRYYAAISRLLQQLNLQPDQIWRNK